MRGVETNERKRVRHANGSGQGAPTSERVMDPGCEAPRSRRDMREGTTAFLDTGTPAFKGR
jgi:hypothetical protein